MAYIFQVSAVRKQVIEPFEQVIKAYGPPGLAMKKRSKRRVDFEKSLSLKIQNKKVDEKLSEMVEQYEALNETLKLELPKLTALTEQIGNMCLIRFVSIQTQWYGIWQEKVKTVLEESQLPKDVEDIIDKFHRDFKYQQARAQELAIVNGTFLDSATRGRLSQSTTNSSAKDDGSSTKTKNRPPTIGNRARGLSINSDQSPSLPAPDFGDRHSGNFTALSIGPGGPAIPHFSTRDFSYTNGNNRTGYSSPATPDILVGSRLPNTRPSTGRSESGPMPRGSVESAEVTRSPTSAYLLANFYVDGPSSPRPFSGFFSSAMPMPDEVEDSRRSSRASSGGHEHSGGYRVLYLAASLFEFNISGTKSEAGYPYLTYQAGEVRCHSATIPPCFNV